MLPLSRGPTEAPATFTLLIQYTMLNEPTCKIQFVVLTLTTNRCLFNLF